MHEAEEIRAALRAQCLACSAIAREHAFLREELRVTFKPWQGTVFDLPGVEAMLEEAIAVKLPDRRRRHRREAVHDGTIEKGSR